MPQVLFGRIGRKVRKHTLPDSEQELLGRGLSGVKPPRYFRPRIGHTTFGLREQPIGLRLQGEQTALWRKSLSASWADTASHGK